MLVSLQRFAIALAFYLLTLPSANPQDVAQPELRFLSAVRTYRTELASNATVYLDCNIRNDGSTRVEAALIATVAGSLEQSVRTFSIEPGANEYIPLELRLPQSELPDRRIEVLVRLVSDLDQPVVLQHSGKPQEQTLTIPNDRKFTLAGFAMPPEAAKQPQWYWPPDRPYASYELALASRLASGASRDALFLDSVPPPLSSAAWSGLRSVVISDARFFDDLAAVEMARRYVNAGGSLWITLDSVPAVLAGTLLGTAQTCEEVDTTYLSSVEVESLDSTRHLPESDRAVDSYEPLVFKRVMQTGGEVSHRIDGWPLAIWMDVGQGHILLTTLDHHGWIQPRRESVADPILDSRFEIRPWVKELASRIHFRPETVSPLAQVEYPLQLVGAPIIPRSTVMTCLAMFCGASMLAAAALYFGRLSTMWLYLAAPFIATISALFLVATTRNVRVGIPEGVSTLQQIVVPHGGGVAQVHEQSAVYLTGSRAMELEYFGDSHVTIDAQVDSGTKRFVQSDFQQRRISNQAWPSGTWRYDANYFLRGNGGLVEAKFDSSGAQLMLPELPSTLTDPILQYQPGMPMICFSEDGNLVCDGSATASGDQLFAGGLLTTEQQRRSPVYRQLFSEASELTDSGKLLFGWTALWAGRPEWSGNLPQQGSAMVALPVAIQRPEQDIEILIPHGFIQVRNQPDRAGTTTAYDESSGRWNEELTLGIGAAMQFVLPEELRPFAPTELTLELDIRAPQRTVEMVADAVTGEQAQLATLKSPSTPWKKTIRDPQLLADFADGIFDFTLSVSEREDVATPLQAQGVVYWNISYCRATVRGSVVPSTALADAAATQTTQPADSQ